MTHDIIDPRYTQFSILNPCFLIAHKNHNIPSFLDANNNDSKIEPKLA